jgi:hypothetical protein
MTTMNSQRFYEFTVAMGGGSRNDFSWPFDGNSVSFITRYAIKSRFRRENRPHGVIIDFNSFIPAIVHFLPFQILHIGHFELSKGYGMPDKDTCATLWETANDLMPPKCIKEKPLKINRIRNSIITTEMVKNERLREIQLSPGCDNVGDCKMRGKKSQSACEKTLDFITR